MKLIQSLKSPKLLNHPIGGITTYKIPPMGKVSQYLPDKLVMGAPNYQKIYVEDAGNYILIKDNSIGEWRDIYMTAKLLKIKPFSLVTIGEIIKHFRTLNDLSIRQLAIQIGHKDHKYLSMLENGKIEKPGKDIIEKLIEKLGSDFQIAIEQKFKNLEKPQ